MIVLPIKHYEVDYSNMWYGNITNEQIRTALFESETFGDVDHDSNWCILTFDDIERDFNKYLSMSTEEQSELFGEPLGEDYTVYDWIRDCMMNTLSVVESIKRKEC